MVARGDLGAELPIEEVPLLQVLNAKRWNLILLFIHFLLAVSELQ